MTVVTTTMTTMEQTQYAMFRSPKERIRLHQGQALQDRRRESRHPFNYTSRLATIASRAPFRVQ